jgi:hypothetical protein
MLLDLEVVLDQQVYLVVEQTVAGGTWALAEALAAVYSLSEKIVPGVVGLAHPQ